jgi:RimJ/RimL family protein N-acetyltransferase
MIEGELIRLRAPERGDLPTFAKWVNDPEVTEFLKPEPPVSMEDEEAWYQELLRRPDKVFCIETKDGKLIGNIGFHDLDWRDRRTILGIMIGEKEYWSRGYGTDAVLALLRYLFEELNMNRVSLIVDTDNARALRCYEKCGFHKEGVLREFRFKRGRYVDSMHMSILRREWEHQGGHCGDKTTRVE